MENETTDAVQGTSTQGIVEATATPFIPPPMPEPSMPLKLIEALLAVQKELTNPTKTSDNPFTQSKYAPLPEILNLVRPILSKHDIVLNQDVAANGDNISIQTHLIHVSGEKFSSSILTIEPDRKNIQGLGSAITYLRRYQLTTILPIAPEGEDDDAQGAMQSKTKSSKGRARTKPPSPKTEVKDEPKEPETVKEDKSETEKEAKPVKKRKRTKPPAKAPAKKKEEGTDTPKKPTRKGRTTKKKTLKEALKAEDVVPGKQTDWDAEAEDKPYVALVLSEIKDNKLGKPTNRLILEVGQALLGTQEITPDQFKEIKKLCGMKVK